MGKLSRIFLTLLLVFSIPLTGCREIGGGSNNDNGSDVETPAEIAESVSLLLSASTVNVKVGESYQLNYNVKNTDKAPTFTSQDPSIAAADASGTITGVSVGETIISVTVGDALKNCVVKVSAKPSYNIRMGNDSIILIENTEFQIVADFYHDDAKVESALKYSSSDEDVATVSNSGKITATDVGECVVTVYTDYENVRYKNYISVLVNPAVYVESAESIVLNYNETATIDYEVKDFHTNDTIDGAVAQLSNLNGSVLEITGNQVKATDVRPCTLVIKYGTVEKLVDVTVNLPVQKAEYNAFAHASSISDVSALDWSEDIVGVSLGSVSDGTYAGTCLVVDTAFTQKSGASKFTPLVLPSRSSKADIEALKNEGYKYLQVTFKVVPSVEEVPTGETKYAWLGANKTEQLSKYHSYNNMNKWITQQLSIDKVIANYELLNGGFDMTDLTTMAKTCFMLIASNDAVNAVKVYIQPLFFVK